MESVEQQSGRAAATGWAREGRRDMLFTAAHDIVRAQIENPRPEAPPGSGSSTALLRHLVWLHVLATAIAMVCCVQFARRRGTGRGRTALLALGVLLIGAVSAAAGYVLGAGLE